MYIFLLNKVYIAFNNTEIRQTPAVYITIDTVFPKHNNTTPVTLHGHLHPY